MNQALNPEALHIVVVTGMSGAGRTSALHVLEDLGFFCVDNLPPHLAPDLAKSLAGSELRKIGLGIDVRTGNFLEGAADQIEELRRAGHEVEVLFLDCADEVLMRRYSETRRPHPLGSGGDVLEAITKERDRLAPLRAKAKASLDTTRLSVHELKRTLVNLIEDEGRRPLMRIRVISFGFKYGLPVDADLVFDLRYLPNPHFVEGLRPLTGLDYRVSDYVLAAPETHELIVDIKQLLVHALPRYEREGKAYLTIAVGCTGGKHRSVTLAEYLSKWIASEEFIPSRKDFTTVSHRDISR